MRRPDAVADDSRAPTERRRHAAEVHLASDLLAGRTTATEHPGRTGQAEQEAQMTRYLFSASYSPDPAKTIMATGGTARVANIDKMVTGMGGRMESFHFASGRRTRS